MRVLILLVLSLILFYQCNCGDSFRIIGSGSLSIKELHRKPTDTITTAFVVINHPEEAIVRIPCGDQSYENSILENSVSISFSKDFLFNEDTITSGTNVLDIQTTNSEIELHLSEDIGIIETIFHAKFIEQCNIPNGEYEVMLKAKTNDDIEIENTVKVYFKF